METKTIDEQTGEACYAKDSLSLVHENLTMTSTMETSGGFGAMMDTSGRSCTDDFGDPDSDCDGVGDDFDDCPGTAEGAEVDGFGCSDAQNGGGGGGGGGGGNADADGDGIPDSSDACPNDYADSSNDADGDGCPDNSGGGGNADADGDGVNDNDDTCPDTPAGESVDMMGCSESQGGNTGGGNGNGGGNNGGGNNGGGMGGGNSGGTIEEDVYPLELTSRLR